MRSISTNLVRFSATRPMQAAMSTPCCSARNDRHVFVSAHEAVTARPETVYDRTDSGCPPRAVYWRFAMICRNARRFAATRKIELAALSVATRKFGVSVMLVALWLCVSGAQIAAQTFTTLVNFDGTDGANSTAGMIRATDGNFYGTTSAGGANSSGTVFKITLSGTLTTLHSSSSTGTGGQYPLAGLIQGKDGNLYGTTSRGSANICTIRPTYNVHCGTIFKITTGGTLTTLASFDQAHGFSPSSPLVQATDGNFYGTMPMGGANYPGFGTVFEVSPTGTLTVLHSFDATDGEKSLAVLV